MSQRAKQAGVLGLGLVAAAIVTLLLVLTPSPAVHADGKADLGRVHRAGVSSHLPANDDFRFNPILALGGTGPGGCACDYDNSGAVDTVDLLFLLANWGGPGADCTGDGTTDVLDLLMLLSEWGMCP